ncbi:SigE family RNA polymerase sigma factor [Lentzea alba]|uniref:SigE family RNA polymerase sigma factor n=1 Tax=Lentzea alba TaxID=2714351 RepID=UPI001A94E5DA|nr:SigE family RNA polymerase sigma factor [Lentzea alba]
MGDFESFAETASDSLLRQAWLLTGDPHKAEDLLQTVLARLWQRWARVSDPWPYARKMLYSTYLTWWRRRWRHEVPTSELPDASSAGPDVELRLTLLGRLASLSRMQRAVLALRYWEDLSVEDTATVLGCSAGSVKTHTARALAVLRADELLRLEAGL